MKESPPIQAVGLLEPGERILWSGAPHSRWFGWPPRRPWQMVCLPFLLCGSALAAPWILWRARRRGGTRYALTSLGRGLLFERGDWSVFELPRRVELHSEGGGEFGDLDFGAVQVRRQSNPPTVERVRFVGVSYPSTILELIPATRI